MTTAATKIMCQELERLRHKLNEAAADYAAQERRLQPVAQACPSAAEQQKMEAAKQSWRAASLALEAHRTQHQCGGQADGFPYASGDFPQAGPQAAWTGTDGEKKSSGGHTSNT